MAATDQADQRASFSNHGAQVDLAAPGEGIYSTWPWVSGYFVKSGTSMATPHVSGVAALVWSRWPTMTADAVAFQIMQTAQDVDSPGWDEYTGWGRLDAARAVMTLTASADLWIRVKAPALVGVGQTFHYQLVYGNDGGTDAQEVWIAATAPVSLTLSTPFSYRVPFVPADNIPYTLTITATVSPDVPVGAELICTATIASYLDLTPSDNTARAVIRVGHSIFLPLLLKEHSDGATWHPAPD